MKRFTILVGIVVSVALLLLTPCLSHAVPVGVDLVFYETGTPSIVSMNSTGATISIGVNSMQIVKTSDSTVLGTYAVTGGMLQFTAPFTTYSVLNFAPGIYQEVGTIGSGGSITFTAGTVNGIALPGAVSAAFSGASGSVSVTYVYSSTPVVVITGGPIMNGTLSSAFTASPFYIDPSVKGSGTLTLNYWSGALQSGTVSMQFLQAVPIPSALILLGPALLGLFGIRKRWKR